MTLHMHQREMNYSPAYEENYMTDEMLDYFRKKLITIRDTMIKKALEAQQTKEEVNCNRQVEDFIDQGHNEELQQRSHVFQRHDTLLLKEINAALARIEDGSYGYCEETGNPIGLKRLEAVPQARYCIHVQERKERSSKLGTSFRGVCGSAMY